MNIGKFRMIVPNIYFIENFLPHQKATELLKHFIEEMIWRQDQVKIYGKTHNVPRLQQWYGDVPYTWSGVKMCPLPWTEELKEIKELVQNFTKRTFNSVLANYYRDGNDTVGFHSDDEPELGAYPYIASVSLGETRDFILRSKTDPHNKIELPLTNGSLLVMEGDTQECWQHCLPRRKKVKKPRINFTFREVL